VLADPSHATSGAAHMPATILPVCQPSPPLRLHSRHCSHCSALTVLRCPCSFLLLPPARRPICHLNNLDSEEDSIIVFLDETEGTSKADIPPWDDGGEGSDSDDDENDPPAKQCVGGDGCWLVGPVASVCLPGCAGAGPKVAVCCGSGRLRGFSTAVCRQ